MFPLVSVVTPCHNAADTVGDLVASLKVQELRDWEAILVDDGSTDATCDVATEAADGEPRITLVKQANTGPSGARNRGLEQATGRYVLFLDCDDWIHPLMLKECIAKFQEEPELGAVYCGQAVAESPGAPARPGRAFTKTGRLFNALCRGNPLPPGCVVWRRELLARTGLFDPEDPGCEDWDMWLQLARLGVRFGRVEAVRFFYRQHEGTLSRRALQMWRSGRKVIECAFAADPRVTDPDPEFASGGPSAEKVHRLLSHALSCCAIAVASGDAQTAAELFDAECAEREPAWRPERMARALQHNMWRVIGVERGDWESFWPLAGTSLLDFLSHVEQRLNAPGFAGRTLSWLMRVDQLHTIEKSRAYRLGRAIGRLKFW